MLDQAIGLLQSRTVWSGIIGFVASTGILAKWGLNIDAPALTDAVLAAIAGVSGLAAVIFRAKATAKIG